MELFYKRVLIAFAFDAMSGWFKPQAPAYWPYSTNVTWYIVPRAFMDFY